MAHLCAVLARSFSTASAGQRGAEETFSIFSRIFPYPLVMKHGWLENPLQMEVSMENYKWWISNISPVLSELIFDELLAVAIHTAGAPNELVTALGAAAHELPLPPPWREAGQSFKNLSCANVTRDSKNMGEPLTLSQSLVYECASDTSVHLL